MTTDPDLLRVLVAAEAARAKVVLIGDDRQLGPVGPGGALRGLVDRAPAAVHLLDENVRQADRAERRALNRLRAGDVDAAINWYADRRRITTAPTRDEALDAMVAAWLADTRVGLDTGLYAWRRANVAELNQRARAAWAAEGRLTGPEVEAPGGRRYAAGDRIVALAPGSGTVTSERGVVEKVDPVQGRLLVRMEDGRRHVLEREATGADRLDHGYAVTVHRVQGATVDAAHRFEDGGGRELAYVSMSRARQRSTVHVVADDVGQAVEDLRRDWSTERRPRWAIDTGTPTTNPLAAEQEPAAPAELRWALRRARLQAERDALVALIPPDLSRELVQAHLRVGQLRDQLQDLEQGTGRYEHTELGLTARAYREAEQRRTLAERKLANPEVGWLARRSWRRELAEAKAAVGELQVRWTDVVEPERGNLACALRDAERATAEVRRQADRGRSWIRSHPTVTDRIRRIEQELSKETSALTSVDLAHGSGRPATRGLRIEL